MENRSSRHLPRSRSSRGLPSADEVGAALEPMDDDMEMEEDDAPPVARPRRQVSSGRMASRRRREEDLEECPERPAGSRFLTRMLLAALAAVALVVVQAMAVSASLRASWGEILSLSGNPVWQVYGLLAGVVLVGALAVAVIAALQDRSAWRCWQLGLAWTALVLIVALHWTMRHPPQVSDDDSLSLALAMSQALVAPTAVAWHMSDEESGLLEQIRLRLAETIGEQEQKFEETKQALEDSQSELTAAQSLVAEMETRHAAANEQRRALHDKLGETAARVETLVAAQQQGVEERQGLIAESNRLREQVETLTQQLKAMSQQADDANNAVGGEPAGTP